MLAKEIEALKLEYASFCGQLVYEPHRDHSMYKKMCSRNKANDICLGLFKPANHLVKHQITDPCHCFPLLGRDSPVDTMHRPEPHKCCNSMTFPSSNGIKCIEQLILHLLDEQSNTIDHNISRCPTTVRPPMDGQSVGLS